MGTNYYLHPKAPCECCGRPYQRQHIGKSSVGWCFLLHIDEKHKNLADWVEAWSKPDAMIVDEYGSSVRPEEMLLVITARSHRRPWPEKAAHPFGWEKFHIYNHSEEGPNGLVRAKIDGSHCVGHGDGTWDLIAGDFS